MVKIRALEADLPWHLFHSMGQALKTHGPTFPIMQLGNIFFGQLTQEPQERKL